MERRVRVRHCRRLNGIALSPMTCVVARDWQILLVEEGVRGPFSANHGPCRLELYAPIGRAAAEVRVLLRLLQNCCWIKSRGFQARPQPVPTSTLPTHDKTRYLLCCWTAVSRFCTSGGATWQWTRWPGGSAGAGLLTHLACTCALPAAPRLLPVCSPSERVRRGGRPLAFWATRGGSSLSPKWGSVHKLRYISQERNV